jgi:hypothetical protein
MKFGAALAHDDVACQYQLATKAFYAEAFGMGIAAVSCTATCFLMSHALLLLLWFLSQKPK